METLEAVKNSKATLEAQLNTQRSLIESMRQELGSAKVRLGVACSATVLRVGADMVACTRALRIWLTDCISVLQLPCRSNMPWLTAWPTAEKHSSRSCR